MKTENNFLVAKGGFHPEKETIKDEKWRERDRLIREHGDGAHPEVIALTQEISQLEREIHKEAKSMEKAHVKKLSSAIFMTIRNSKFVHIRCVGNRATYNAVKAIAIATGYCKAKGIDLYCQPSFDEGNIGKLQSSSHVGSVTAILFTLKGRKEGQPQE